MATLTRSIELWLALYDSSLQGKTEEEDHNVMLRGAEMKNGRRWNRDADDDWLNPQIAAGCTDVPRPEYQPPANFPLRPFQPLDPNTNSKISLMTWSAWVR